MDALQLLDEYFETANEDYLIIKVANRYYLKSNIYDHDEKTIQELIKSSINMLKLT